MEQKKKGGIRKGAGRKPSENPKKLISLYVEKKAIWLFGDEEKLKNKLYEFICNYNSEPPLPIVQKQKDYLNNLNQSQNWTQKTQNEEFTQFEAYMIEMDEAKSYVELKKILSFVDKDFTKLTKGERMRLNQLAEHLEKERGFYRDII